MFEKRTYIATFYTHFGAVRFHRERKAAGEEARMMPVPRSLSSSCGTCVRFVTDDPPKEDPYDEIEQIVEEVQGTFTCIYRSTEAGG